MELTQEQCLMITQKSIAIMQNWGMSEQDIVKISGLEGIIKARHMERYKKDEAFPNKNSIYVYLEHILGIDEALATTYPRNNQMARMWINRPHRRFAKQTPKAFMLAEGQKALVSIRMDLDCAFAWQRTTSK